MRAKNAKPPVVNYAPDENGHWEKPETDAYYTLITKYYDENGAIKVSTWFFPYNSIANVEVDHGHLALFKRSVSGRKQHSVYPLSEVVRFDTNGPSEAYFEAMEAWCEQEFHVSYDEWHDMQNRAELEKQRNALGRRFGVDSDSIVFDTEIDRDDS